MDYRYGLDNLFKSLGWVMFVDSALRVNLDDPLSPIILSTNSIDSRRRKDEE